VPQVEQRTISGDQVRRRGQSVLFVTERCVFALHGRGIEPLEVAPGIGIERDVLALMGFVPRN
jgi:propionate CoA-transferase